VTQICKNCPKEATLIMGADINAALGTNKQDRRNEQEDENDPYSILGPYGIEKRNERGEEILNLASSLDLRVATSYFEHKNGNATRIHKTTKQRYQPDHFFITRKSWANVTDARKRYDGAPSDHLAVMLKLKRVNKIDTRRKSIKEDKNKTTTTTTIIDYNILRKNDAEKFKSEIKRFANNNNENNNRGGANTAGAAGGNLEENNNENNDLGGADADGTDLENIYTNIYEEPPAELLERFEQYVVETAKNIAELEKKTRPDWFTENELELTL
jgi:hypothetical protein